ncbi:MAG: ATP-binding cassette domain-containing protein [Candidatus Omnitrophota bacterium]|nr:ATP-binding cassette domain-containing protein [Candidatus Omnitrophota bacterium]
MITIANLFKNYGEKALFENVSLSINKGEKVGLIGPNGSGKTTLFALILGQIEPSKGAIRVNKNTNIGYLAQEAGFKSEHLVLTEVVEGDEKIRQLKKEKQEMEDKNEAASSRYGEVLHELETRGYFELEHKAKKVLMGLGFKERDFARPITQLSGGWQMRVLLAKLLTHHYDLLLLDEPTNYLDLNAALWLKDYLAEFPGTFIMISHDKAFLTEVTNYTLILENAAIAKIRGNYEHFRQVKDEQYTYLLRQFKEQEKKRKQLEVFISRFHAQPNKAAAVRSKRTALERMEEEMVILPPDTRSSIRDFHFPQPRRSGQRVIKLGRASKSYGDICVYKDLDFEVSQGQKAVLAGENGAGKSTLLKILAGVVDIDCGERVVGHNVEIGYFSQTRMDVLNPENTVLREAYSAAPGYTAEETIRTILGAFLFSGDDVEKPVKVLSGGEKSRLILAKLLINPPNFLLLDEPTTHLDVDAVDALVKALNDYAGTIVFISHDIYFVRSVANTVFEVKDGRIREYPGNFDYYLEKKQELEKGQGEEKRLQLAAYHKKGTEIKTEQKKEKPEAREESKPRIDTSLLRSKIKKLQQEEEGLKLERYAKARALSSPRIMREEETLKEYTLRLQAIDKRIIEVRVEIKQIKAQLK